MMIRLFKVWAIFVSHSTILKRQTRQFVPWIWFSRVYAYNHGQLQWSVTQFCTPSGTHCVAQIGFSCQPAASIHSTTSFSGKCCEANISWYVWCVRSMDAINSYTKSICYYTHKNCPSSETDPFIECMIILKDYCELWIALYSFS